MAADKTLLAGSTGMMLLKLLEKEDMYGYQMTEELKRRSNDLFALKAGTLYPLLHSLETKGYVRSYLGMVAGRERRYYALTKEGRSHLTEKQAEWKEFSGAVSRVLEGGALLGTV